MAKIIAYKVGDNDWQAINLDKRSYPNVADNIIARVTSMFDDLPISHVDVTTIDGQSIRFEKR